MTTTAIIYARVSTARQADDGLPVESQIDQCQAEGPRAVRLVGTAVPEELEARVLAWESI